MTFMETVWSGALLRLFVSALVSALLGVFAGAVSGLALFAAILLSALALHLRQMQRLVSWAKQPAGTEAAEVSGPWSLVYGYLNRRVRNGQVAQMELKRQLKRFRQGSEALPDGIITLRPGNIIDWFNPAAERHLGLRRGMDEGAALTNLVRQPDFVSYLEKNAGGRNSEPQVIRSVRQPGLTLSLQIIEFGANQSLLLTRDISAVDRLETMRRDFVANVSHELKTPLTVVKGFVETLQEMDLRQEADDAQSYLLMVQEQASRMQHLVEDLLTLAGLETGNLPASEDQVSLSGLLAEVRAEAEALSGGRHFIDSTAVDGCMVLGCRQELRSAFANLTSNAVRYTPDGGHIRLEWCKTAQGGEFSVVDDGIGIEAQHIPRLTERFYRVDRGRSRESGGTGLGLAIVKHVLTRHQAELVITSTPGQGSRFSVRLPKARVRG